MIYYEKQLNLEWLSSSRHYNQLVLKALCEHVNMCIQFGVNTTNCIATYWVKRYNVDRRSDISITKARVA